MNGVRIDPVSPHEYLRAVESFLSCGHAHVVHFCSAHPTVEARRDASYRAVLNTGALNVPDGAPVAWAAALSGARARRLPGTQGMRLLAGWGVERGVRHYLYGGTEETLSLLQREMSATYPGILVVGAEAPPFRPVSDDELHRSVRAIQDAGTQVLWVGLGAPKQDLMAYRLRALRAAPAIMCVGAAFDFVAGTKRRAPAWMQRAGLEWLHRLGSEPTRLWKRYLLGNPRFVASVVSDLVAQRRAGARSRCGS